MTTVHSTNDFSMLMLDRIASIQQRLSPAIKFALPRFWEAIGNRPFPGFFNHIQRITFDPTQGLPIRQRVYTVEMRLIVGGLAAGYKGENEDAGSQVLDMILDLFDARRRLELEGHGALDKVVTALMQPLDGGVQPFDYTDVSSSQPPLFYLGIPFLIDVTANHRVGRITG